MNQCCEKPRKTMSVSTRWGKRIICNSCGAPWKETPTTPTSSGEGWEKEFDLEFEDCRVVHIYETEQFKKMKEFVRTQRTLAAKEVIRKIQDMSTQEPFPPGTKESIGYSLAKVHLNIILSRIETEI